MNGYLFPKGDTSVLTQILLKAITDGKLSPVARNVASMGRRNIKNLMVSETIEGYALLLENVLKLSSEVARPKAINELAASLKEEWRWNLFEGFLNFRYEDRNLRSVRLLNQIEEEWNNTQRDSYSSVSATDDTFLYEIWAEEKSMQTLRTRKKREEDEVRVGLFIHYVEFGIY